MDLIERRAEMRPNTYDPETRTFEAVASTYADVKRAGHIERLDPEGHDPADLIGKPFLDGHKRDGIGSILGHVTETRREGDKLFARVQLAETDGGNTAAKLLASGAPLGVSLGFRVDQWRESTERGRRVKTAARYENRELSAVAIPADPGATVRSDPMPTENTAAETVETQTRTAEERREHRSAVRSLAEASGLSREWADEQIDSDADLDTIKARAFDEMAHQTATRIRITHDHTDPENLQERRASALYARHMGGEVKPEFREFMGDTLKDHAKAALQAAGVHTRGLSADEVFRAAMHSTSDFPELLTSTGDRTLKDAYELARSPILDNLCRTTTFTDFRPKNTLGLSDVEGGMPELPENGEITYGTMRETAHSWNLSTFAKEGILGRNALINDDLAAFLRVVASLGRLASQKEISEVLALIAANPNTYDGVALFNAPTHGNLTAAQTAFNVAALNTARQAMRTQKDETGEYFAGVTPAHLVVGPALESRAEELLATIYPTTVDQVNSAPPLALHVEPRIEDSAAMIFANPAQAPVLWVGYLAEAPGPQFARDEDFDTMGQKFRVVLDFGVTAEDWRGVYRFDDLSGA